MPESKWAEHLIWHIFLYPAIDLTRTLIIRKNHKHIICVPQTLNSTKKLPDVILGVDSRATKGEIVCDNNYEKIHYLPPNIYYKQQGKIHNTFIASNK